jgi:hypothetical protein
MGPLTGVPRALERRQRGPDRPLLAAEEARLRGLRLFSKQFRGYSPKFGSDGREVATIHRRKVGVLAPPYAFLRRHSVAE